MYLSKMELNPRSRRVRAEIAHPYQMHRTVMGGFPDFKAEQKDRVLFRVDTNPRSQQINLLVQSEGKPDFASLESDSDYCVSDPLWKEFKPVLHAGQQRYFRLRANPTVKSSKKLLGLLKEEQQQDWLSRKAGLGGFRVDSLSVTNEGIRKDTKRVEGTPIEMSFLSVLFEGVLEVLEPDRFLETMSSGVGRGKGIGFGLLSIAPFEGE